MPIIIYKPYRYNLKEELIRYGLEVIESLKQRPPGEDPDTGYKRKFMISFHKVLIEVIGVTPADSFIGFIQLVHSFTLAIFTGQRLIPYSDVKYFPPGDVRGMIDQREAYQMITGYFALIDSYYTPNNRGRW